MASTSPAANRARTAARSVSDAGAALSMSDVRDDAAGAPPIINIMGEKVALGPLHRGLLPADHRWTSDFATLRMQGIIPRPLPMLPIIQRYESAIMDDTMILFAIYERATMRPIGVTNLKEIDRRNRTAEFVVFSGERDAR